MSVLRLMKPFITSSVTFIKYKTINFALSRFSRFRSSLCNVNFNFSLSHSLFIYLPFLSRSLSICRETMRFRIRHIWSETKLQFVQTIFSFIHYNLYLKHANETDIWPTKVRFKLHHWNINFYVSTFFNVCISLFSADFTVIQNRHYGNCFTFNFGDGDDEPPRVTSKTGALSGNVECCGMIKFNSGRGHTNRALLKPKVAYLIKEYTSSGHAMSLWKKRCGIDQKRLII